MSNQTKSQPNEASKDAERLDAERRGVDLASRAGEYMKNAELRIAALSDNDLRIELLRLQKRVATLGRDESGPRYATLRLLMSQCAAGLFERFMEESELERESDVDMDDFGRYLADTVGLHVAEDGLIELDRITDVATRVVGELPIAVYHHTSSALIEAIRAEGLRVGKPTNFFNTQQGVYVSTIRAGQPVSVYSRRAARVHGGEPITLRVRRKLSEIKPDPDDADLAWAQGRQYVTPSVPPEDVMWEAEEPRAEAKTVATTPESAAAASPAQARKMRPR